MAARLSSSSPSTKTLDHIVHLTPPGTVEQASEQFRALGFTSTICDYPVIHGGTHADGLTANALVILGDAVYLELISFTQPASSYPPSSPQRKARDSHQWANKPPGWLAFAFLGAPDASPPISALINARAEAGGSDVRYAPEVAGGRRRGDGVALQWVLSTPRRWAEPHGGSRLPFYCGDVTPRALRVPTEPKSNAAHPNTAQCVARMHVLAPRAAFAAVSLELQCALGEPPIALSPAMHVWLLDPLPEAVAEAQAAGVPAWHPRLILQVADESIEEEVRFVDEHGPGLYEVSFRVEKGARGTVKTPYGRISWIPSAELKYDAQ
ncbi:hypothetical protein DENSPDRAFT_933459 [Dentipellis sp. KUC8613]|nr:hypothetical protein DENSPDRAFT_933459 [Dentipellis sp. KUC8613]